MRKADGSLGANSTWVWADVPRGGAGFASGVTIHAASGRQFTGTDTSPGLIRDPGDSKWTQVFATATMQAADYTTTNLSKWNCIRGRFAPSDKNRLYSAVNGYWFKVTIDPAKKLTAAGAITCTRWPLGAKRIDGGAGWNRWWECHPAIHPTDENTVLLPTSNDGVYYSTDGLATVNAISVAACTGLTAVSSTITSAEVGRDQYLVWIDQGNANYCYIFVQGSGLYCSTTGVSGTFSLITGGPTGAACLFGEADGTLWIAGDERIGTGNGGLWSIARGGSSFTSFGNTFGSVSNPHHVAVDPFNSSNVLIIGNSGQGVAYSANRGTSWSTCIPAVVAGGEAGWHTTSSPKLNGGAAFDPTAQNRILWGEGFGSVVSTAALGSTLSIKDYSSGVEQIIEEGVANHPTTGRTMLAAMDLPQTPIDSWTQYLNTPGGRPVEDTSLQEGRLADYALDDSNFWVAFDGASQVNAENRSYSTDNGVTWHRATGSPPSTANTYGYTGLGAPGAMAVSTKTNWVACPSNDAYPSYTKDGGATWNPVLLNGSSDYSTNHADYIRPRVTVAADKTRAGVFAMIVGTAIPNTSTYTSPYGGLWVTTDGGDTWTQNSVGVIGHPGMTQAQVAAINQDGRQYYACQISYVPGFTQELLYTPYGNTYGDDRLFYSTDDGQNWVNVGPTSGQIVRNVRQFGFGKQLPQNSGSRPAVYFYGDVAGATGCWVTFDWFASCIQLSDAWPHGYATNGNGAAVGADGTTFGRMICSIGGRGSVYSTYQDIAHAA